MQEKALHILSDRSISRKAMGERRNRRGNQFMLDAEQLDNNSSKARHLNKRATNRLLLAKDSLDGQRENNMNSIKYEMKQLEHDLRNVKQSSGYVTLKQNQAISPTKRKARKEATRSRLKGPRKKQNTKLGFIEEQGLFYPSAEKESVENDQRENCSLPTVVRSPPHPAFREMHSSKSQKNRLLSSFCGKEADCEIPTEDNRKVNFNFKKMDSYANLRQFSKSEPELFSKVNTDSNQMPTPDISITVPLESIGTEEKDTHDDANYWRKSRKLSKSEKCLANLSVDAAKDRVQNRLSAGNVSQSALEKQDSSAFLYAPPDGLPRTVYLLPPLEELFDEAKKARYIRKFRRPKEEMAHDDPERELGIDEIFGKDKK